MACKLLNEHEAKVAWSEFTAGLREERQWMPISTLNEYEGWKSRLEGLSFWTGQGERLALLGMEMDDKLVGIVRALKVPVFSWQREAWGKEDWRGEIQDFLLRGGVDLETGKILVEEAMRELRNAGLRVAGASEWRADYLSLFEELGFEQYPYSRSILLGWRTDIDLEHLRSNEDVKVLPISEGKEELVRSVFFDTWGFRVTILPDLKVQDPLVSLLDGEPVGTVLPNRESGNLDLGVQVVSKHRRTHIGTRLIVEAIKYYRRRRMERMYVIRNLPLGDLSQEDNVALSFYKSTGAVRIREYTGFRAQLTG